MTRDRLALRHAELASVLVARRAEVDALQPDLSEGHDASDRVVAARDRAIAMQAARFGEQNAVMMSEIRSARKRATQLALECDALITEIEQQRSDQRMRSSHAQALGENVRIRTAMFAATLEAMSNTETLAASLANDVQEEASAADTHAATAVHLAHLEAATSEIAAERDFLRERLVQIDALIGDVSASRTLRLGQQFRRLTNPVRREPN